MDLGNYYAHEISIDNKMKLGIWLTEEGGDDIMIQEAGISKILGSAGRALISVEDLRTFFKQVFQENTSK